MKILLWFLGGSAAYIGLMVVPWWLSTIVVVGVLWAWGRTGAYPLTEAPESSDDGSSWVHVEHEPERALSIGSLFGSHLPGHEPREEPGVDWYIGDGLWTNDETQETTNGENSL